MDNHRHNSLLNDSELNTYKNDTMKLSVAYTFEKGLIKKLSQFKEIHELYGKLNSDCIGGGRSSYTLRKTSYRDLQHAVNTCKKYKISFNYLLNGATLGGLEQTRQGHKTIRKMLDLLTQLGVTSITAASPMLVKLIKKQYPHFKIRVSAFAVINSPLKAKQWADIGADTLCISAISCNRNFSLLESIRRAVSIELQLIVNATCLIDCAYELTHMNLLSDSSRKGHRLGGMCLDYCVLNCTLQRIRNSEHYIKATWIRPEDIYLYENMGYQSFKIVERSCPGDLLVKRVKAYVDRRFDGNLYEIAGPIAQIKKEQKTPLFQRIRMTLIMMKPWLIKVNSLRRMKNFAQLLIPHDFSKENTHVYIDNRKLDGFLEEFRKLNCENRHCHRCDFCRQWAEKTVTIDTNKQRELLAMAESLERDVHSSSLWIGSRKG